MTHLGDATAALVDGELEHEAGARALAHLAGCAGCRADVEAQRRLKAQVLIRSAGPCVGSELPESLALALLGIPQRRSAEGGCAERGHASVPHHPSAHRRARCVATAGLAASVVVGLGGGALAGGTAHAPTAPTAATPTLSTPTTAIPTTVIPTTVIPTTVIPTTPAVRIGGTALSVVYRRP